MDNRVKKRLTNWISLLAALVFAAFGMNYVAVPHLAQYYAEIDPDAPQGYDLWTYAVSPTVLFRHGENPYDNDKLRELVLDGMIRSNHPDPIYDGAVLNVIGSSKINGYVGSPFSLFFFHLLSVFGYAFLFYTWPVISILLVAAPFLLIVRRWTPNFGRYHRLASYLWMTGLLMWNRPFWVHTVLHGQIDAIYVAPVFAALVLLFPLNKEDPGRAARFLAGFLLGFAACIKVFPVALIFGLAWIGLIRWFGRNRAGTTEPLWGNPYLKTAGWGAVTVVALCVITALAIKSAGGSATELTSLWWTKAGGSLHHPQLLYVQNHPHMAPYFGNYLRFLIRVWLRGWEWFSETEVTIWTGIGSVLFAIWISISTACRKAPAALILVTVLTGLPLVLPHWWNYYNTVLLAAFPIVLGIAAKWSDRPLFTWKLWAGAAFVLMTLHYVWIADLSADLALVVNGNPTEFVKYHLTFYNALFGFPGNLLLFAGCIWTLSKNRTLSRN
jgi:Glycosyltransferase family 87